MTFASCDKESNEDIDPTEGEEVFYEIDEDATIDCTAEQLADLAFGKEGSNADENMQELRELYLENVKAKEDELNEEFGGNSCVPGYRSYKFYYNSKDLNGNTVRLSGRVAWGTYWFFGWHNADPDNIFLLEHYTITNNSGCPSEDGHIELALATGDNLLIMPDYIGYGSTKDMLHPYLNHEIVVTNSIDALKAGYEVWKKYGSGEMEDDWRLYTLGASQGASNALAVHKYFDTHDDEASKWRFDYSYCCAGAYNPALTMEKYYEWGKCAYIGAIPMTIKSMIASYPSVMAGYSESDFYSEKYLKVKSKIDDLLSSKEADTSELNKKIKELLGTEDPTLADILSKTALDTNSGLCKAFFSCLEKNDLTTGWTPKHMIKLYAGENDDIVPYANTEAVVKAFGSKVNLFKSYWTGHVNTCYKWYGTLATGNW
jgi:hypothetical protein